MLLLWQHYGYLSSFDMLMTSLTSVFCLFGCFCLNKSMNDQIYLFFFTQVTYRYNILQECQILDTIFDSMVEKKIKNEIRISARPAYVFIYSPVTDLALYVLIT